MKWWYENEEEKMEFDKSRVYTSLNADELKRGDKVFVANSLNSLKRFVEKMLEKPDGLNPNGIYVKTIYRIRDFKSDYRFDVKPSNPARPSYPYAYLVERAENCTNCGSTCGYADENHHALQCSRCDNWQPKAEPKTEKKDIKNKPKEIDMNWNYEGLPEKQEMGVSDRVVVAVRGYNVPDVGYYDYDLEAWFVDGNRYPVPVYAWHYDKPPKEEA